MLKPIRRVVTGHDASGKATVSSDGAPPGVFDKLAQPGLVLTEIWATDTCPAQIGNGQDPTGRPLSLKPSPCGTVIRVVDLPPDQNPNSEFTHEMGKKVFDAIGAGDAHTDEPSVHPGMHRTETIDYGIVLQGEIYLLLEDSEVKLQAGDIVIQRGTIHAWANRSDQLCRIAFILLDGRYTDEVHRTWNEQS